MHKLYIKITLKMLRYRSVGKDEIVAELIATYWLSIATISLTLILLIFDMIFTSKWIHSLSTFMMYISIILYLTYKIAQVRLDHRS